MRLILNQASRLQPGLAVSKWQAGLLTAVSPAPTFWTMLMNLYQAMIEQTADAFILADLDGNIQLWNDGAQTIFGFSSTEAIGQSLDIIIPEHLRAAHWVGYHKAIAAEQILLGDQVMTTRSLRKDGSKAYVDMRFSLIKNQSNQLVGVLATARDSTARYLAERALHAQLAKLKSA
jgi:PAS domain S-box-containing protein